MAPATVEIVQRGIENLAFYPRFTEAAVYNAMTIHEDLRKIKRGKTETPKKQSKVRLI
jgi:hypothetical protein